MQFAFLEMIKEKDILYIYIWLSTLFLILNRKKLFLTISLNEPPTFGQVLYSIRDFHKLPYRVMAMKSSVTNTRVIR